MKRILALVLSTLFFAAANAATFTVTNINDSGPGSLRDAVVQAYAAGGQNTVNFAVTGTIVLTSGRIQLSGALNIVGPGADKLTIDGNGNGNIFSVFLTDPTCPSVDGPDYLVSISGLRLTNGLRNGRSGGAIFSEHSLWLDSVVIDKNVAGIGGGAMVQFQYSGQELKITNSQFLDNVAKPAPANPSVTDSGGALLVEQKCANTRFTPATVTIANSVFSGNRAQPTTLSALGGAIGAFAYADITIADTRIVDNHVDVPTTLPGPRLYRAGGIAFGNVKAATIVRSEISDNSTVDPNLTPRYLTQGGGITLVNAAGDLQAPSSASVVKIVNSTVSGNTDTGSGGGIWVYGNVAVEVYNSTISGNSAPPTRTGGMLFTTGPTAFAPIVTATAPTLTMVSSIVAGNSSDDIATSSALPTFTINATNSLIGTLCSTCNISVTGSGNMSGVDPMLDMLDFNGGPTRTQALLLGSPAIAAGSNPLALDTDQRGPGFPREVNGATDIGAYQFQPSEMLSDLIEDVADLHFQQAVGLLTNALKQVLAGHVRPACNDLDAFVNQVRAQSGKQLTPSAASELIASAGEIRAALGCN